MNTRIMSLLVALLLFVSVVDAKSSSSSSRSSSSRSSSSSKSFSSNKSPSSSSWGSNKSTATTKPTSSWKNNEGFQPKPSYNALPAKSNGITTNKSSDVKPQTVSTNKVQTNKADVKSPSKWDNKSNTTFADKQVAKKATANYKSVDKNTKVQNKVANKKYGSVDVARQTARQDLYSRNKYSSATAPSVRPRHIPQHVTINNINVNSSYGRFPGGGYGYGYMHPVTGMFVALAVADMMVDDDYMAHNGYGTWGTYRTAAAPMSAAGAAAAIAITAMLIGFAIW